MKETEEQGIPRGGERMERSEAQEVVWIRPAAQCARGQTGLLETSGVQTTRGFCYMHISVLRYTGEEDLTRWDFAWRRVTERHY